MQKISGVFISSLLLLFGMSFVVADNVTDADLDAEIDAISSTENAEYRLEQITLALESQIDNAMDVILELGADEDVTSELEGYIAELEVLLDRVQAIDLGSDLVDIATEALSIRIEAIEISQKFRDAVWAVTDSSKIQEVKEKTKEMRELRRAEAMAVLKDYKDELYLNNIINLFSEMGIDDADALAQLESGDLSHGEATSLVRSIINGLSDEEKEAAKAIMTENRAEVRAEMQAKRAEMKAGAEAKRTEIRAKMQEKRGEKIAEIKSRRAEWTANMEDRKAALQDRIDNPRPGRLRSTNN